MNSFKIEKVPFIPQGEDDGGPTALAMVMNFYGRYLSKDEIRKNIYSSYKNTTVSEIVIFSSLKGFEAEMYTGDIDDLKEKVKAWFPIIVAGQRPGGKEYFMVVWGFDESDNRVFVHYGNEPSAAMDLKEFMNLWRMTDYMTFWIYPKSHDPQQVKKVKHKLRGYGWH